MAFYTTHAQQMALALTLGNYGAEPLGDEARDAVTAHSLMMLGLIECGHGEDESEIILDTEYRTWLHAVETDQPYALKRGAELLERFAWA